jgi:hypothetical protein
VGGFRPIAAQPRASIDAEAGLAYDRSGGEFDGRVYLVYTSAPNTRTDDTDIKVRFSDDDGGTWSGEIAVSSRSRNSQFLPRTALDQTTGRVGFAWYDARNDNGRGKGSTNRQRNDDAQLWAAAGRPTEDGLIIRKNFRVSKGTFNARAADNAIDLGDYIGLTYHRGFLWPVWADNSNSTGDNPDGKLNELDLYTARVRK